MPGHRKHLGIYTLVPVPTQSFLKQAVLETMGWGTVSSLCGGLPCVPT